MVSHLPVRRLFAFGAVLTVLAAPTFVLTGCGSGGGGDPSPSPSAGANQTTVTGKIVDINAGSAGLAGATVQFAGASVQTDAEGNFSLAVPRNTAAGNATITAPAGTQLYAYTSTGSGCANALTFSVAGPLSGASFSVGTVSVYRRTSSTAPNPPCL